MFWKRKESPAETGAAEAVTLEAEGLFRSGKMHCAEAVLTALKNRFLPDLPHEVAHLASGFGGGSGSGCVCGAVAGATMAFGLILKDRRKSAAFTKELHHWFRHEYHSACCRVIREREKGICAELTGRVAGKAAEMLAQR